MVAALHAFATVAAPAQATDNATLLEELRRHDLPAATRYLRGRQALAAGTHGVDPVRFWYAFALPASFLGDYDAATGTRPAALGSGPEVARFVHARPAVEVVRALASDRRVVIVNEDHLLAQSRTVAHALLAPLREAGFTHLAAETFATLSSEAGTADCGALADAELAARGHAIGTGSRPWTGFYTREPIYGEIIRDAMRLGYVPVAYEHATGGRDIPAREQGQARNLACLLEAEPDARVLVIVGHGHASEALGGRTPEGMMAARLKRLTGLDPLTIETTRLLRFDRDALAGGSGMVPPDTVPIVLADADGTLFTEDGYDLLVAAPVATPREQPGPSWLELGGLRQRHAGDAVACDGRRPCILEARPIAEGLDGTPSDGCVVTDPTATGCSLFLRPGRYLLRTIDDTGTVVAGVERVVP